MAALPKIEIASVKVMRSFDYCHFEICLSASLPTSADLSKVDASQVDVVDELRKTAARLADKAVEQYQIAKVNANKLLNEKQSRECLILRINSIRKKDELSRTVREQAELKAFDDEQWQASRRYDYDDEWEEDRDEDDEE